MSDHYVTLLHYLESRRYFHIGAKPRHKSFSYIHNATFQLEKLLFADATLVHGKTFYIADYIPIDLLEWCNALARGLGAARPPAIPLMAAKVAARVGDFLEATFAPGFKFNSFRLRNIVSPYVFDVTDTESITGPLPWTFDESVQQTVRWYRGLGGAKRSGR